MPNDKYLWNPEKLDTEFKPLPGAEKRWELSKVRRAARDKISLLASEEFSDFDLASNKAAIKKINELAKVPDTKYLSKEQTEKYYKDELMDALEDHSAGALGTAAGAIMLPALGSSAAGAIAAKALPAWAAQTGIGLAGGAVTGSLGAAAGGAVDKALGGTGKLGEAIGGIAGAAPGAKVAGMLPKRTLKWTSQRWALSNPEKMGDQFTVEQPESHVITDYKPTARKTEGKTSYALLERKSNLTEGELDGKPRGERNQKHKPTTWLQGDDAIKMFNDYGGMDPIVENSPLMARIMKYVPEARERYGLVGDTNISDETIAKALYKRAMQLSGKGNGAVNEYGEPLILFRGDTQRYSVLDPRMSPEELATKSTTMDNSLGTLFLDYPDHYQGLDRYIGTAKYFNGDGQLVNSGTGSKVVGGERPLLEIDGVQTPPEGSRLLYRGVQGRWKRPISVYKLPASQMESGVNDINAFIVKTPSVRDATSEIAVLNDNLLVEGKPGTNYHGKSKLVYDENGFPEYLSNDGTRTPALAGYEDRNGMAEHYRHILNDAESKEQGLLKSNKGSILRDEHTGYDYYALPNFNIRGAKHLLGYDLNYPLENSWSLYRKQGGSLPNNNNNESNSKRLCKTYSFKEINL